MVEDRCFLDLCAGRYDMETEGRYGSAGTEGCTRLPVPVRAQTSTDALSEQDPDPPKPLAERSTNALLIVPADPVTPCATMRRLGNSRN